MNIVEKATRAKMGHKLLNLILKFGKFFALTPPEINSNPNKTLEKLYGIFIFLLQASALAISASLTIPKLYIVEAVNTTISYTVFIIFNFAVMIVPKFSENDL